MRLDDPNYGCFNGSYYLENDVMKSKCWNCGNEYKKDPKVDCMDATCYLCHAPYDKSRCEEFGFMPTVSKNLNAIIAPRVSDFHNADGSRKTRNPGCDGIECELPEHGKEPWKLRLSFHLERYKNDAANDGECEDFVSDLITAEREKHKNEIEILMQIGNGTDNLLLISRKKWDELQAELLELKGRLKGKE